MSVSEWVSERVSECVLKRVDDCVRTCVEMDAWVGGWVDE